MTPEWIEAICIREQSGTIIVASPMPYPGTNAERITVEIKADTATCAAIAPQEGCGCGLEDGHVGPHWLCAVELIEASAPMRLWSELNVPAGSHP